MSQRRDARGRFIPADELSADELIEIHERECDWLELQHQRRERELYYIVGFFIVCGIVGALLG